MKGLSGTLASDPFVRNTRGAKDSEADPSWPFNNFTGALLLDVLRYGKKPCLGSPNRTPPLPDPKATRPTRLEPGNCYH